MQTILVSQPNFSIEDANEDSISGAAKVDLSPESCIFLRMHFPIWRQNDRSFAHISSSIAPRTKIIVSIPMFSMFKKILAMSEFT